MTAADRCRPRRRFRWCRTLALVAALPLATTADTASAQTPSERALAESLFREGKELLTRGDVAAACRKLEESQRLDPVGGTLLNLATCHEKEGKIATAWAEYQSALELAKRASRRDRIALAQRKVDELAPRVPYLTITIEGAAPPGLHVELDGVTLGEASLGTRLAVDPGDPRFFDDNAYVADGVLVASLPESGIVVVSEDSRLSLRFVAAFLAARLVDEGGPWALREGVLAARLPTAQIFQSLDEFRDGNGDPLCTDNPLFGIARDTVCESADIFSGTGTPTSPCDSLSVGIGFEAEAAMLGPVVDAAGQTPGCPEGTEPSRCDCSPSDC